MMTHDQALDLVAASQDFALSSTERAELAAHLAGCVACRQDALEIDRDATRLRSLAPIPPPAWVARAITRKRRPTVMLLVAAVLVVGGSIGVVALAGAALNRSTADVPSTAPGETQVAPTQPLPSPLPRLAGWSAGRDLLVPRADHTATLLGNGSVLIAGGRSITGNLLTAELYEPATDSFRAVGPMQEPHLSPTATLLLDGRVLVVGGTGKAAEIYDPPTGSWSPAGRLTIARYGHTATLLPDGRVLVVGGTSTGVASRTAELFDPSTGRWVMVGQLAEGRTTHTASLLPDGRVLVVGGEVVPGLGTATGTAEIFDPVSASFSAAPPMLEPRGRHTATVLGDGRVLVVSGASAPTVLTTVELFDPVTQGWSRGPDVNEPHEAFTLTVLDDGRILIAGGYSQRTLTAELRDAVTGSWSMVGPMTAVRGHHTAIALQDGRVLVTGGVGEDETVLASTELWLPLQ